MESNQGTSSNQQTENERHSTNEPHLVSIREEGVEPTGVKDKSIGEQGHGDDFMGRSNLERRGEDED